MTRSFGSVMSNDELRQRQTPSPPHSLADSQRSSKRFSNSPRLSYISPAMANHPTLAALESMSAIEQRDQEVAAELKNGRAGGFTAEPRRVGDRRKSSRSSSSKASYSVV
jgi:hypothetical protein